MWLSFALQAVLAQLAITDANFDQELRRREVALVVFVAPWCGRHCTTLRPLLGELAAAFTPHGVAIASASSEKSRELIDRFQVETYPTIMLFDGTQKWPYYASEAQPERYRGERTFGAIAGLVARKAGVELPALPKAQTAPVEPSSPSAIPSRPTLEEFVASSSTEHACTAASGAYTACMRHRRDRQRRCAKERHEYLLCMSGRWTPHPDHHQRLAKAYELFNT